MSMQEEREQRRRDKYSEYDEQILVDLLYRGLDELVVSLPRAPQYVHQSIGELKQLAATLKERIQENNNGR